MYRSKAFPPTARESLLPVRLSFAMELACCYCSPFCLIYLGSEAQVDGEHGIGDEGQIPLSRKSALIGLTGIIGQVAK